MSKLPAPQRLRVPALVLTLAHELSKFGAVGLVAFTVDVGGFNLLRFAGGHGPLYEWPIAAKVLSAAIATVVSWLGNRYWTFRHRRRAALGREFTLFVAMCVIGTLPSLACLAATHYLLDLRSPLADNISANLVGLGIGTVFRFWAYRTHVFNERPPNAAGTAQRRSDRTRSRMPKTMRIISRPSETVVPKSPVTEDVPTRG